MRLSCKELAAVWGISVTKVSQARDPAFRKVALCLIHYPEQTLAELYEYAAQARRELESLPPSIPPSARRQQVGASMGNKAP